MYPIVTRADAAAYVARRHENLAGPSDLKVKYVQTDTDWVEDVEETLESVLDEWRSEHLSSRRSDQSRDGVEGRLAGTLHRGFSRLPALILTDRDFWRFSAAYLYDFVAWRQPTKTAQAALPYFSAKSNGLDRDCVPSRMFGRAHIARTAAAVVGEDDLYALASFGAADLWKSHILRVANGNAPLIARELVIGQRSRELKTDLMRPLVKNLRRVRSNVLFEVLDQHQAHDLVHRETARTVRLLEQQGGAS